MKPKIDIKRILNAVDQRDYEFYKNLSDEEKELFSPFTLMSFTSNVKGGGPDIEEWFIETTNEYVNKNFWVLYKDHKELLWKLYAMTGIGKSFYHPYLSISKKKKTDKFEKLLEEIYPTKKIEDIRVLASLMNKKDRQEFFDNMGLDQKQRKEYE